MYLTQTISMLSLVFMDVINTKNGLFKLRSITPFGLLLAGADTSNIEWRVFSYNYLEFNNVRTRMV